MSRGVLFFALAAVGAQGGVRVQILHGSDFEGGQPQAPNFAAIVQKLQDNDTIKLSGGDNWLPGPYYSAADDKDVRPALREFLGWKDAAEGPGRADVAYFNLMEMDASGLGNHEFDAGTVAVKSLIGNEIKESGGAKTVAWYGTQFPYLSATLNFTKNPDLSPIFTDKFFSTKDYKANVANPNVDLLSKQPKISPWAKFTTKNGNDFCLIGATTPIVETITVTNGIEVFEPARNNEDMKKYAQVLQPQIDRLVKEQNCSRIILIDHIQQLRLDQELLPLLKNVDILLSAGHDSILVDEEDKQRNALWPGDDKAVKGSYPIWTKNADGEDAVILSTDAKFRYVGRLVVEFDDKGRLNKSSVDEKVSGSYSTTDAGLEHVYGSKEKAQNEGFANGTYGYKVKGVYDAIDKVITRLDGIIYGHSTVFMNGIRATIRTEETNLGNLVCDSALWYTRQEDDSIDLCVRNSGGIRTSIGVVQAVGDVVEYKPPPENSAAGKKDGDVSQLDINAVLKFNDIFTAVNMSAANFKAYMEHGLGDLAWGEAGPLSSPGALPYYSQNLRISFDPNGVKGEKIKTMILLKGDGSNETDIKDVLVMDGKVNGDPNRTIRFVTGKFVADGGDAYPTMDLAVNGSRTDFVNRTEQSALSSYLKAFYPDSTKSYSINDTSADKDMRGVNLFVRKGVDPYEEPAKNFVSAETPGPAPAPAPAPEPEPMSTGAFAGAAAGAALAVAGIILVGYIFVANYRRKEAAKHSEVEMMGTSQV